MSLPGATLRLRTWATLGVLTTVAGSVTPVAWSDAATVKQRTLRSQGSYEGFGEAFAVATARLDGRHDEVVLGGRGIAALDDTSLRTHRPRWSYHWTHTPGRSPGGDNQWVNAVVPLPVAGHTDLIVSTSENELIRFDGRNGRIVWRRSHAWQYGFGHGLSLVSTGGNRAPAIAGDLGTTVYSSADGRPLWTAPVHDGDLPPDWVGTTSNAIVYVTSPNCNIGGLSHVEAKQYAQAKGTKPPRPQSPKGGVDCKVYHGHLSAYTSAGKLLWQLMPSRQISAMTTGDRQIVVGETDGQVAVYSQDGKLRWHAAAGRDGVSAVQVVDGRVYAAVDSTLVAFDGHGRRLWALPMAGQISKLAATGSRLTTAISLPSGGSQVALVDAAGRQQWQVNVAGDVEDVAVGSWRGRQVVTVGGSDSMVHGLWADSGRQAFGYLGDGWITGVASGRLNGRRDTPVAHTDDQGHVVLSDARGSELWRRDLGRTDGVTIADVGHGRTAVIAAGADGDQGVLRAYDAKGRTLWTGHASGELLQIATARLGRGGPKAIVAVVWRGGVCGVAAFDASTGRRLWEHAIAGGISGNLAIGDVDGSGLDAIAFSTKQIFAPGTLALLSPTGEVRWKRENVDIRDWLAVAKGHVIYGGQLAKGTVASVNSADGTDQWQTDLGARAEFGIPVPQRSAVAASTDAGVVGLLDAATGHVVFRTQIVAPGAATAGPLAVLPSGDLAVSESGARIRTQVHILSPSGRVLATSHGFQQGQGFAIASVSRKGLAVGAGLSIYMYEQQ